MVESTLADAILDWSASSAWAYPCGQARRMCVAPWSAAHVAGASRGGPRRDRSERERGASGLPWQSERHAWAYAYTSRRRRQVAADFAAVPASLDAAAESTVALHASLGFPYRTDNSARAFHDDFGRAWWPMVAPAFSGGRRVS